MFLYLWIHDYKHIKNVGFNLSSNYEFSFTLNENPTEKDQISGELKCKKKFSPNIFNSAFLDIKAIIGENGAGKSTVFEVLTNNFLTEGKAIFNGFLITEKYVLNRMDIDFGNSINSISDLNLKEIRNIDLVNSERKQNGQKLLNVEDIGIFENGQIASTFLKDHSIIQYSPIINLDRIFNFEGIAGSNRRWETTSNSYYDYTNENIIVKDYRSLNIDNGFTMTGESELLSHKTFENKRSLEFLLSKHFEFMPFKNQLEFVDFKLNDFYEIFWKTIDNYLKSDADLQGRIQKVLGSLRAFTHPTKNKTQDLEINLYIGFIFGILKYELQHRSNFREQSNSNALFDTLNLFVKVYEETSTAKDLLKELLKLSNFCEPYCEDFYNKIEKTISFILENKKIIIESEDWFRIPFEATNDLIEFLELYWQGFLFNVDKEDPNDLKYYLFGFISVEFDGFSTGEKALLSMFGRLLEASNLITNSTKEVILPKRDIILLLDEPEATLHPYWQTQFINLLNDTLPSIFVDNNLQLCITSHSPIILSDLPKSNVIFLEKEEIILREKVIKNGIIVKKEKREYRCKLAKPTSLKNTFGANVHSLYADAFFLKENGGTMGKFSKKIIHETIREIKNKEFAKISRINGIIKIIGEPLIKDQIQELFKKSFPDQNTESINNSLEALETILKNIQELKNSINEGNR